MSSFYGSHSIEGGGGGGTSDYNELINTPITNITGSALTPVSFQTLNYGVYHLSGFYKYTIDGEVYEAEPPILVKVIQDEETHRKVVYYETCKNGKLVDIITRYKEDGTAETTEEGSTVDDPDIPWTDLDN